MFSRLQTLLALAIVPALGVGAACLPDGEDDDKGDGGTEDGGESGDDSGDSGDVGSDDGSDGSDTGDAPRPGEPGWVVMDLLDDPDESTPHAGNDLVSDIYFEDLKKGWIATRGDEGSFQIGGMLYKAEATAVTDVLVSGRDEPLDSTDFRKIDRTPYGMIALLSTGHLMVVSQDGGASFETRQFSDFGVEDQNAFMTDGAGNWLYNTDVGVIWTATTQDPGPGTFWEPRWAPQAVPTTPNPVPEDQCQEAPRSASQPGPTTYSYISEDLAHIVYPLNNSGDAPAVCVSRDSGNSFFPVLLPDAPENAGTLGPRGVVFIDDDRGWTFDAITLSDNSAYVYRTLDGGDSWEKGELPPTAAKEAQFRQIFFAPDGKNGWIVGDFRGRPLVFRSDDGGLTWTDISEGARAAFGDIKLMSGYALDANHIWIGGKFGLLAYNGAGGDV